MSEPQWRNFIGSKTCDYILDDSFPCGGEAIVVNEEGTVYLCAICVTCEDSELREIYHQAKIRRLNRMLRRPES